MTVSLRSAKRSVLSAAIAVLAVLMGVSYAGAVGIDEAHANDYTIYMKSQPFIPDQAVSLDGLSNGHVLIQLFNIPSDSEKATLERDGIKLLVYMPNYAWFASITDEGLEKLSSMDNVRWIGNVLPEHKLKIEDVPENAVENGNVIRLVQFYPDVDLDFAAMLVEGKGFRVYEKMPLAYALVVAVPEERIDELLALDEVQYTEIIRGPFSPRLDLSRQRISVNEVQVPPLSLTGAGVNVLIYDAGSIASHPDYNGRVQVALSCGISAHATAIAGIIGGTGSLSVPTGNLRGMATQVTMVDHCINDDLRIWNQTGSLEVYYRMLMQPPYESSIASNSWGVDIGPGTANPDCNLMGDYEAKAFLFDRMVRGDLGKKLQVNFAVPNLNLGRIGYPGCGTNPNPPGPLYGNYGTITVPDGAKNVIGVGSTYDVDNTLSFTSSRGPVDDGRIKPDMVAPGEIITTTGTTSNYRQFGGTSFATPHVSGSAALLMQLWKQRNNNQEPIPSTIKALFMQGAQDIRNPGPDYEVGFGQINVSASANLIADTTPSSKYVLEGLMNNGEEHTFFIIAPGNKKLKATVVWDDKEGTLNSLRNLINDIDMKASSPTNSPLMPYTLDPLNPSQNAGRGEDHTNNVEQIELDNAQAGTWKLTIKGTSIPYSNQTYSLVSSFPLVAGATLTTSGTPRVGIQFTFNILDETAPSNTYILAMSLTNTGIPLGDGRIIPLGLDPLLLLSIQSRYEIGLINSIGSLNPQGRSTVQWTIPNVPQLAGISVYTAFVVINPSAPSGIQSISNGLTTMLQP